MPIACLPGGRLHANSLPRSKVPIQQEIRRNRQIVFAKCHGGDLRRTPAKMASAQPTRRSRHGDVQEPGIGLLRNLPFWPTGETRSRYGMPLCDERQYPPPSTPIAASLRKSLSINKVRSPLICHHHSCGKLAHSLHWRSAGQVQSTREPTETCPHNETFPFLLLRWFERRKNHARNKMATVQ